MKRKEKLALGVITLTSLGLVAIYLLLRSKEGLTQEQCMASGGIWYGNQCFFPENGGNGEPPSLPPCCTEGSVPGTMVCSVGKSGRNTNTIKIDLPCGSQSEKYFLDCMAVSGRVRIGGEFDLSTNLEVSIHTAQGWKTIYEGRHQSQTWAYFQASPNVPIDEIKAVGKKGMFEWNDYIDRLEADITYIK